MEEELNKILKDWKVAENYIEKLTDEEVFDKETLLLLSEDMINSIFIKAGPRALFLKKLNDLRKETQGSASAASVVEGVIVQLDQESEEILAQSSIEVPAVAQATNDNGINKEAADVVNNNQPQKRPLVTIDDFSIDLHHLLKKGSGLVGKEILSYYKEHDDLNETYRNKLADILINEWLSNYPERKLPPDVEAYLTTTVITLFPNEDKDIWMASRDTHRDLAMGRGVLLKRYYHKRRDLRISGVIDQGSKKLKKGPESRSLNFLGDEDSDSEVTTEQLSWLKNNKHPWDRVVDYWQSTSKTRLRSLIGGAQSIESYLNEYPGLKDKSGYLLLEQDFKSLYSSANSFYAQWPMFAAFVESRLSTAQKEAIDDSFNSDAKKARTVQALCNFFSTVTVAKGTNKKTFRPSRLEVAQTILLHVKTIADIVPTLTERAAKYEKFKLNLTPQAIIVGDDEDSIDKCYVRVNSVSYEVENPLKAVDVAFKIMHALDCKYPKESEREWLFIERAIYNINVDKRVDATVSKMVQNYNKFKTSSD